MNCSAPFVAIIFVALLGRMILHPTSSVQAVASNSDTMMPQVEAFLDAARFTGSGEKNGEMGG
jgi:hypothetical protein